MNKININEYILYCFGLIGITIYLLYYTSGDYSYKNYDSEQLEYIHWLCGILAFFPIELAYGKMIWYIIKKEDFEIKFLFSERKIYVK